jgi:excisionase family DNA binding protein
MNDLRLLESLTISVEEAGALLRLGRNAAYNAVRDGKIPSIRVGGRIRVPTQPLKKMFGLIEELTTASRAPAPDDNLLARKRLQQALKCIDEALAAIVLARAETQAALSLTLDGGDET